MDRNRVVVVGASAGGMKPLLELVAGLASGTAAALFVTMHIGSRPSHLPAILAAAGPWPAAHAVDGEPIQPDRIYVAPPDHHLLLTPERIRLSLGPLENGSRPAVDPMFRSAARSYGRQVIGIVLSGALADGTAGLMEIKRLGGLAVVQDPGDAQVPGMPRAALRRVAVDRCVPGAALAAVLLNLVAEPEHSNPTIERGGS